MKYFGKKGVFVIFVVFMCYFIGTCFGPAGMSNTVIPALAAIRGFDAAAMMSWCSIAGWISVVFIALFSRLGERIGSKKVMVGTLLLAAVVIAVYGAAGSLGLWIVMLVASISLSSGYQYFAGPALIASWFPQKKGMALGWASMGIICCDLLWTPYIRQLIERFGPTPVFLCVGGIVLVVAIIFLIFVRNTPEEAGTFPDNCPTDLEQAKALARISREYRSSWTAGRLLRTKEVWLLGVAGGLMWMGASGPVVSFFPRLLSLGYDNAFITSVFQIAAFISLVGSWLFGFLDTKWGTKKTLQLFGVLDLIFLLIMFLLAPVGKIWVYISAAGLWACVGGIPNLIASMQATLWGRWDYPAVSKVISTIVMCFVYFSFILTAFSVSRFGSYSFVFIVMCVGMAVATVLVSLIRVRMMGKTDDEVRAQYPTLH